MTLALIPESMVRIQMESVASWSRGQGSDEDEVLNPDLLLRTATAIVADIITET